MGSCAYGQNYASSGYLTSHYYDGEAGTRIHHGVSLQDILIVQLKVTCVVLVHNGTKLNGKRNELVDSVNRITGSIAPVLPMDSYFCHLFIRGKLSYSSLMTQNFLVGVEHELG